MNGALLSEVWPDMVVKKQKRKKQKVHYDKPLTVKEMDTELLDDNNDNYNTERKLKGMSVSPYTDNEIQYQNTKRKVNLKLNDNIVTPDVTMEYKKSFEDDPEYFEFLEYKKKKFNFNKSSTKDEQFNELLLYIFTGFFLLMIYDNIYKLGKNSY
jgi:hypothetical protein